ncbi:serine-rich adhesin for platelets-like isoform X2 [Periplaneta americana]|uniref:serine-rich adhesin for platelets-like isoform X2 n=1 Tax=Periplaneta americana TaxID=6978 RepID=UPI0037E99487
METGFLNLHDEEHFSTLPSPLYDQDMLEDSDVSLLDMIRNDFSYEVAVRNFDAPDLWGTEQELNGDMAVLPLTMPLDGSFSKLESHTKEDFQKMLTDWQEHLGSLQASDTEDMDVKDIVGLDMVMPKQISENLPDDIFEDDSKPYIATKKHTSPIKLEHKSSLFGISIKDELSEITLDNFMDSEEDEDLALNTAEDEAIDVVSGATEVTNSDIKVEMEEDCIDVETVSEQIPVLEAGDLTSLLEQFEASEAFNTNSNSKPSVLDTHLYAMATQQLSSSTSKIHNLPSVASTPTKGGTSILSHQNIKDSLPKEVIDRIKASGRKKAIPVIPAMPTRRPGRGGTRMQDAGAALSRNKLLKIVSGSGNGESVQLDHDYCTVSMNDVDVAPPPRSFYHSDASEYVPDKISNQQENEEVKIKSQEEENVYSRLPEYYMVLAPQKLEKNDCRSRKGTVRDDECWGESNSKKDSGLESGEVSDASEEIASPSETLQHSSNKCIAGDRSGKKPTGVKNITSKTSLLTKSVKNCSNVLSVNGKDYHIASNSVSGSKIASSNSENMQTVNVKPAKEMTMISVLKKCHIGNISNSPGKHVTVCSSSVSSESSMTINEVKVVKEEQQGPKKRKLNLEEYRSRLKELDRIRGSRESSRANSPVPSCSVSVSVGTSTVDDETCVTKDNSCITAAVVSVKSETVENVVPCSKEETTLRPVMQSVEVQTIPEDEVPVGSDTAVKNIPQQDVKERKGSRTRDRRKRQYRSRRASSSSSSASSSSSNSRSSRRRHTSSRSRHRRRPSWRRSSTGRSNSSSGSRSHSIWSRSPSSDSEKSSCSSYSLHSRSRSRSSGPKSSRRSSSGPSRRWRRSSQYDHHERDFRRSGRNYTGSRGWRRSRSPLRGNWKNMGGGDWQINEREKQRQVEERRVIYVGRIEEGTSKAELRRRFEMFGPIVDISVHFREHGDNYGFVTFAYKVDAYEAVEHGNDDPNLPHYDLCFGGRRAFCKTRYADLDGMATKGDPVGDSTGYTRGGSANLNRSRTQNENSFDLLLREAQAKLRKRKA